MIKYTMRDGVSLPVVECDSCHKPITANDGNAVWSESGEIKFEHHGDCSRVFDWRTGYPYWEPLEVFLRYLIHNTQVTKKPTKHAAVFMETFGQGVPRKAVRK